MSRSVDSATLTELGKNVVRVAHLALIEFPSPHRLAFTTLPYEYPFSGETFISAGALGSVSQTSESGSLEPSNYQITLSGVNDDVLSAAEQLDYMNHKATVWVVTVDEDAQVVGSPFVWFKGRTDQITVNYGDQSSVVIDIRDRMADWSRPRIRRYTDENHQAEYPGDKFFEFVTEIGSREVEWPADTWFEKNA